MVRTMTRRARSRLARASVAFVLGSLGACATGSGGPDAPPPSVTDARLPPLADIDPQMPMVRGEASGLEAHWWVVNDADLDVARTLAPYEIDPDNEDGALGDGLREWKANGFRLARVPLSQYDAVRGALPPSRTFQRVWVGEAPEWRELIRGRSAGGERRLLVEGRLTQLPAGKLRLLTRAWVVPSAGGARLHVEAVPQIDLPDPGRMRQMFEQIDRPPDLSKRADGVTLDDLFLSMSLREGEMVIITADRPGADWSRTPPPRDQQVAVLEGEMVEGETPDDDGSIPWDPGAKARGPGAGPRSSRALTIGEAMLASSPEEVGYGAPKVVVVLIPRLPDRFRLLIPDGRSNPAEGSP